jgi:hypothetical protein
MYFIDNDAAVVLVDYCQSVTGSLGVSDQALVCNQTYLERLIVLVRLREAKKLLACLPVTGWQ